MANINDYRLRYMSESDLEIVLEWRNSERIRKNMYTDHVIKLEEHRAWYQRVSKDDRYRFMIFEFLGAPVGFVSATDIDQVNRRCNWAFYLGSTDVPKGTGSIMEYFALEFVFYRLKIRKLCCEVFSFNRAVVLLHQKFGFKIESNFTKHALKDGDYVDVVGLALFNDEWAQLKAEKQQKLFNE